MIFTLSTIFWGSSDANIVLACGSSHIPVSGSHKSGLMLFSIFTQFKITIPAPCGLFKEIVERRSGIEFSRSIGQFFMTIDKANQDVFKQEILSKIIWKNVKLTLHFVVRYLQRSSAAAHQLELLARWGPGSPATSHIFDARRNKKYLIFKVFSIQKIFFKISCGQKG